MIIGRILFLSHFQIFIQSQFFEWPSIFFSKKTINKHRRSTFVKLTFYWYWMIFFEQKFVWLQISSPFSKKRYSIPIDSFNRPKIRSFPFNCYKQILFVVNNMVAIKNQLLALHREFNFEKRINAQIPHFYSAWIATCRAA